MAYRIFLVEDHPIARKGYRTLLAREPDLEVCGEADSAESAFALISELDPDLVISDLALPGVNGIELVKRLVALDAGLRCLVISAHDEMLYAERALAAGARGYLMKQTASREVVDAIRLVLSGKVYVSEQLRDRFILQQVGHMATRTPMNELTDRELEIFEYFGRGKTTHEVADALGVSAKTVESHRANIRRKLGLRNGPEFVHQAVLWAERSLDAVPKPEG